MPGWIAKVQSSLKWKLILTVTVVIIFTVASIGFFSYYETSQTIQRDIEHFSTQILVQANLNLNRYFVEYEQAFSFLQFSSDYAGWLKAREGLSSQLIKQNFLIEKNYVNPFLIQHPEVLSMTLYHMNGNETHYRGLPSLTWGYSVKNEMWFGKVPFDGKLHYFIHRSHAYIDSNGKKLEIPVISIVKRTAIAGFEGYIKADISLEPTQKILSNISLGRNGTAMIIDDRGRVVAHPDSTLMLTELDPEIFRKVSGAELGAALINEERDMAVYQSIPYTGWKSLVIIPYSQLASSVMKVRNVTIVIALISLAASFLLLLLLSSSVTRRISQLKMFMRQAHLNRYDRKIPITGKDELAELGRSYNHMLMRLDESIEQLAEAKVMQQKAALSALQSQINSHFLYNTLESINALAAVAGQQKIGQTAVSLSKMLRYASNLENDTVTLEEETAHLAHYLTIIQIRYGSKINYHIDVGEDCKPIPCLKAILQPMVENSVKHGIESTGEAIEISIGIYRKDGYVYMEVQDTGRGFDEDKLFKLQKQLKGKSLIREYNRLNRVGILNVHYRLKMYYEDDKCGVFVSNRKDVQGAVITVVFPEHRRRKKDVSNIDRG